MKKIASLILCALLLLCFCACGSTEDDTKGNNNNLTKAADFTVFSPSGEELRLSALLDKPIVLNFWASWCPPCKSEMPDFEKLYLEYGDKVNFVMVSVDDNMSDATAFMEKAGYTFPYYHDQTGYGSYFYDVSSIPRTYFINKDGYIVSSCLTMITEDQLKSGIEGLLPNN